MLKRWLVLVAAAVLLARVPLASAEVAVPPLLARVTDLSGSLSASQIQSLDSRLRDFERAKGSQIAVLMLPTTGPEAIEQYSIRVAEAWKIGRAKIDDGVILVIAKDDRKLRIEVGRGLEGAIPDARAKRVVSDVIAPRFKSGDFYGGIAAGTEALMKLIEGESLPPPRAQGNIGGVVFVVLVLLVLGGWLLVQVLRESGTRPPHRRGVWTSGGRRGDRRGEGDWFSGWFSGGASGGRGWGGFGGGDSGGFSGGGGGFGGGGASGSW